MKNLFGLHRHPSDVAIARGEGFVWAACLFGIIVFVVLIFAPNAAFAQEWTVGEDSQDVIGEIDYNRKVLQIGDTVWVNDIFTGDSVYGPIFLDTNGYVFPHMFARLTRAVVTEVLVGQDMFGAKIGTESEPGVMYRVRYEYSEEEYPDWPDDLRVYEKVSGRVIPQQRVVFLDW